MKMSKVIRYMESIIEDVGDINVCYLADDQNGFIDIHFPEVVAVTGVTDEFEDGKQILHCAFMTKQVLKDLPDESLVPAKNLQ